jgi:hypothetical protein
MGQFYFVKRDDYHQFLEHLHSDASDSLAETSEWLKLIENSSYWNCEIVLFAYFLSIYFEQKMKKGYDCVNELHKIFGYKNCYSIDIQEFDVDFIDFLMRGVRGKSLNLHDLLHDCQCQYKESRGKLCVSIM